MSGKFITFEGGEGSGKTTVINNLKQYLQDLGYEVVLTREPGGIKISEQIRDILLDVSNKDMTYETETLLYAASRMQHLSQKVLPALNEGKIVICDRYLDSSLVYQGYARKIGYEDVLKANHFALKYIPDMTFFLDVEPSIALKRIESRKDLDRLDLESRAFHELVYQGYKDVSLKYANRIKTVDASLDETSVLNQIKELIKTIL